MSPDRIVEILRSIPSLPDTAVLPLHVVAAHDHVSSRTVRRNYPLTRISPNRYGVTVGFLRNRAAQQSAA
jgi:hypothetical protein